MTFELSAGLEVADRFTLRRSIGEGGMGMVWAADDKESGNTVALKFIKGASTSVAMRRRFLREARAASAIDHDAIVRIQEILELDDGAPVLVMELLEGESLAQKLDRERTIELEALANIMQPVVSALGTAHALGIIHRDLKPENIFLARGEGDTPDARVLDFGIAKLTAVEGSAAQSTSLTGTGSLVGTPYYMAPEQVFGEKDLDHRVDVWALGLIFYECLAGVLPTEADNVGQVFKIVLTRGIPPLEEARPEVPKDVADLINRMLSRRRDERPKDLREVRRVLKRYTDAATSSFGAPVAPPEEPPSSDAIVPIDEAAIDPLGATAPAITARPQRKEPASSRTRILVVGAGLIAAATGYWTLGRTDSDESTNAESGADAAGGALATATDRVAAAGGGSDTPSATALVEKAEPAASSPTADAPVEPARAPTTPVAPPPRRPVATAKPPPKPKATAEPEPTAPPKPTASQPKGPKIQNW